jgi:hypothetical protein
MTHCAANIISHCMPVTSKSVGIGRLTAKMNRAHGPKIDN